MPSIRRHLAFASFCLVLALSAPAFADDLADFEVARRAYEAGEYAESARLFESMVGGEVPRIRNELLVLESRKYLAVSYLFVDRVAAAEAQFEALLRQDATYQLDPVAFPATVYDVFRRVGDRVRAQEEAARAEREEEERRLRQEAMARLLAQQERIARLEALAREMVVVRENSRGIALLPFGIGQFRNGHRVFGIALATIQSILLVGSVTTFALHQQLRRQLNDLPNADTLARDSTFIRREAAYRITNITSTSLLAASFLAGLIDAQVRYRPTVREVRQRELPDSPPEPPQPELSVRLGLGSAELELSF